MSATFQVNTKVETAHFVKTFGEYIKVTHRSFVDSVNNKLFMIARKASWFTRKTDKKHIARDLGKITFLREKNYNRLYRHTLKKGTQNTKAPLAALIANKRLGVKKEKGLYGSAMRQAIQQLITARNVSIAYIKSGWLPAIQTLAKVATIKARNARDDKDAQRIGREKGRAVAAINGDVISGLIENEAWAKRDKGQAAFLRYGNQGLQHAIDSEWKDTAAQIEKEMKPAADAFNASQH